MKTYGTLASFYDDVWKGSEGDLEFYLKEALKAEGPVLEAACGTGRILLPLFEAGVDIEGFDITPKMISVLRKKNPKPGVWVADMRNFKSKRKYSLIIVPYRSFLHLKKSDDQIMALKNFKKHLKTNGKLILNFFYPDYNVLSSKDGKKSKKSTVFINGKKYSQQEKISISPIEQFNHVEWLLACRGKTKKFSIDIAYIYKKEFELLLRIAGFRKWKVFGGFNRQKLTKMNQEMVWMVEK
ncbi:class I SAM-dependent methyltransferase [Candidatus Micrarchaeota archaeon]|nr:class I SAM-dependent methyltransferase [Candidatus Micrarchaeota archaeon]